MAITDTLIDGLSGKYILDGAQIKKNGTLTAGTDTIIVERDYGNGFKLRKSLAITVQAAVFAPTDYTGLMRWFDASDSYNGTVWTDKSGNAGHAVDGAATTVPTLVAAAQNGKSVVRFAAGNGLETPDFDMGLPTIFVVAKPTSTTGVRHFLRKWQTGQEMIMRLTSGAMTMNSFFKNEAGTQQSITGPTATIDTWATFELRYDGTIMANSINGGTETTGALSGTSILVSTQILEIGCNGTSDNWIGDMAEIIIYNRQLTSPEKSAVRSYLTSKWGL